MLLLSGKPAAGRILFPYGQPSGTFSLQSQVPDVGQSSNAFASMRLPVSKLPCRRMSTKALSYMTSANCGFNFLKIRADTTNKSAVTIQKYVEE